MASAPSVERDEAVLGGTLTTDLMVGVLGARDDHAVWGLNLLVHHKVPCCLAACSVLCEVTVHRGGGSAPYLLLPDK